MRINSILAVVAVTLATKVCADCFATELGHPCCSETTDIVSIDEYGNQWGIENGVKCGIEYIDTSIEDEPRPGLLRRKDWSNYMNKIKIEEFCPVSETEEKEGFNYATFENVTYSSTTTGTDKNMVVILPPNYNPNKKYPLLFLLHGIASYGAFFVETEDLSIINISSNLMNEKKAKEMIIVCPDQFTPTPGVEVPEPNFALFANLTDPEYIAGLQNGTAETVFSKEYLAAYDNFINDLVDDILPYMYEHYPVAKGRENTAICGYSFGGRNSLYIGFTRPDLFGYIGAFSPAPGIIPGFDLLSGTLEGLYKNEEDFRTDIQPIVNMISCGTKDSIVLDFPKQYHNILTANDQEHIWYEISDVDHTDAPTVTSPFYNFLKSVFGKLDEKSNIIINTTKVKKIKTKVVTNTKTNKFIKVNTKKVVKTKKAKVTRVKKINLDKLGLDN